MSVAYEWNHYLNRDKFLLFLYHLKHSLKTDSSFSLLNKRQKMRWNPNKYVCIRRRIQRMLRFTILLSSWCFDKCVYSCLESELSWIINKLRLVFTWFSLPSTTIFGNWFSLEIHKKMYEFFQWKFNIINQILYLFFIVLVVLIFIFIISWCCNWFFEI